MDAAPVMPMFEATNKLKKKKHNKDTKKNKEGSTQSKVEAGEGMRESTVVAATPTISTLDIEPQPSVKIVGGSGGFDSDGFPLCDDEMVRFFSLLHFIFYIKAKTKGNVFAFNSKSRKLKIFKQVR